ncbi:DgyrCDS6154 [Dimorphilus gyrociliatus]|uniref:DgyrCDS6154 n=1 Tax=Dimorphilus gyrociliatus TaxID=2664684 RepID=A0A7I8VPI7_9ANNE|nr:DgyrCDS6154 [Dimorphilus gyrociliatus]
MEGMSTVNRELTIRPAAKDLAKRKKVTISSTFGRSTNEKGISFAVDGLEDTCLIIKSSKADDFPWMTVNLGNIYNVTHVYIYSGENTPLNSVSVGRTTAEFPKITELRNPMNKSDICFPVPVSDFSITDQICSKPLRTKFISLFSKFATELRVCQFSVFDDPLEP